MGCRAAVVVVAVAVIANCSCSLLLFIVVAAAAAFAGAFLMSGTAARNKKRNFALRFIVDAHA